MSEIATLKDKPITLKCHVDYFVYYCYVYLNPLKPGEFRYVCPSGKVLRFDFEPFYVGKGKGDRLNAHTKQATKSKDNTRKLNTIRKIFKAGLEPIIIDTTSRVSDYMAMAAEIDMIAGIGRRDKKLGPLTNLSDGLDGSSGYRHSKSKRKKISKNTKGKTLGIPKTKEHCAKISAMQKARSPESRIVSQETCEKLSKALKGKPKSNAHKLSMSVSRTGRKVRRTQEHNAKIGAAQLGKTISKEQRAKQSLAMTGKKRSKASCKKQSATCKVKFSVNGIRYKGLKESAPKIGISVVTLRKRLRSKDYPKYSYL